MQTLKQFLSEKTDKVRTTPHAQLRQHGWKKTNKTHDTHVYTHPEHTGHEIHLHVKTGSFEHKVNHKTNDLSKHLSDHSRFHSYVKARGAMDAAHGPKHGW